MPGHIRIVNDPVESVPLLMTFNDPSFKKVYELLNKSWLTEEEIRAQVGDDSVALCLQILKKGNLVEEQWRMPKPGANPEKEFRATYNKFRANFQCNLSDLSDILYIALSNDENLREVVEQIEGELQRATARSMTFPGNSMSAPSLSRDLPNGLPIWM